MGALAPRGSRGISGGRAGAVGPGGDVPHLRGRDGRNHDLPWPAAELLAGLARLLGIDAAADGPMLVLHTLRQTHRLAVTWDLVLDPVTCGFFFGGLVMLALAACVAVARRRARWPAWLVPPPGGWPCIVLAWLPLRTMLLLAVYLHRAMRTRSGSAAARDEPVPLAVGPPGPAGHAGAGGLALGPCASRLRVTKQEGETAEVAACDSAGIASSHSFSGRLSRPAPCCSSRCASLAIGLQWEPAGTPKPGAGRCGSTAIRPGSRPTAPTTPRTTAAARTHSVSYTYTLAYQYLGQFYDVSRLAEAGTRSTTPRCSGCDVLVIKIPTARYTPGGGRRGGAVRPRRAAACC